MPQQRSDLLKVMLAQNLAQPGASTRTGGLAQILASLVGGLAYTQAGKNERADAAKKSGGLALELAKGMQPRQPVMLENPETPMGAPPELAGSVAKAPAAQTPQYGALSQMSPEALEQVLAKQMFEPPKGPEFDFATITDKDGNQARIRTDKATAKTDTVYTGGRPPEGPLSSTAKILADYDAGRLGGPAGTPAAIARRDAALDADAGRGSTTVNNIMPNGNSEITAANRTSFNEKVLGIEDRLATLRVMKASYDPTFLTLRGKFDIGKLKARDITQGIPVVEGVLGGKLDEDEKTKLKQWSRWSQSAYQNMNETIREVTGATVGQGDETTRLKGQIPDPRADGPTEFVEKANAFTESISLAQIRYKMALKDGIPVATTDDLVRYSSLDGVKERINDEASQMVGKLTEQGMPKDQAIQKAIEMIQAQYGIKL